MKRIISLFLALLVVFALASCAPQVEQPAKEVGGTFAEFEEASYSTISSRILVTTTIESKLGELNSSVETVFNPNGSATVNYTVENFAEDFTSSDIVTKSGTITYKNGEYTGDLSGEIGDTNIASVDLVLDKNKMDYTIKDGTLSAFVKAENVKSVLGIDIPSDVHLVLTKGEKRISSLTLTYTLPAGAVTVVCTYN